METEPLPTASFARTIQAPVQKVWQAWADAKEWSAWVLMDMESIFTESGRFHNGKGEGGRYFHVQPTELLKFTWEMRRYLPGSYIEVVFEPIGTHTTLCTLHHHDLQRPSDVDDANLGWNWAMDSLQSYLETGKAMSWEAWEAKQG